MQDCSQKIGKGCWMLHYVSLQYVSVWMSMPSVFLLVVLNPGVGARLHLIILMRVLSPNQLSGSCCWKGLPFFLEGSTDLFHSLPQENKPGHFKIWVSNRSEFVMRPFDYLQCWCLLPHHWATSTEKLCGRTVRVCRWQTLLLLDWSVNEANKIWPPGNELAVLCWFFCWLPEECTTAIHTPVLVWGCSFMATGGLSPLECMWCGAGQCGTKCYPVNLIL